MNMLIVGNGFDLAHNIKTHYADFLDFITKANYQYDSLDKKNKIDFETVKKYKTLEDILENVDNYSLNRKEIEHFRTKFPAMEAFNEAFKEQNKGVIGDNELVEIINDIFPLENVINGDRWNKDYKKYNAVLTKFLNENIWLDYFNHIYEDRYEFDKEEEKKEYKVKNGWIDFESEISKVIKIVELDFFYNKKNYDTTSTQMKFLLPLFNEIFKENEKYENEDLINLLDNELEIFTYILELYLYFEEHLPITPVFNKDKLNNELKINALLSFNYTDIYREHYNNTIEKIDFIHGKLGEHNIILGTDETLTTQQEIETNISCIRFKKYFQRISKNDGINKIKWINKEPEFDYNKCAKRKALGINEVENIYEKKHNIYVIGHSLDVTDKDIIKKIFTHANIAKITVYYFNKQVKDKQIANLIKILGKETLLELTGKKILKFKNQKKLMPETVN